MKNAMVAASLAAALASPALANDTMAELGTGGLVYLQTDAIEMAEEHLFVSENEIKVDYTFHNKTDKDVEALIAFPMPDIAGNPELNVAIPNYESDNFLGFRVTQDGQPIETGLDQRAFALNIDVSDDLKAAGISLLPFGEKIDEQMAKLDKAKVDDFVARGIVYPEQWDVGKGMEQHLTPIWSLRSTYWWRTTFPAGQDVKVSHTYKTAMGGTVGISFLGEDGKPGGEVWEDRKKTYCADDDFALSISKAIEAAPQDQQYSVYFENWIHYILRTGANWAGPIGKFTLTVDKGSPDNLVSFCGEGVKKIGPTTFEMTATDYYPQDDLHVLLMKKQTGQ